VKKQVVVIGGGDTFDSYEEYIECLKSSEVSLEEYPPDWKKSLQESLGDTFEIIRISMPSKINAKYSEWRLWFEKYLPLLNNEIVLIGHSLGGIFLAKYLAENKVSKNIVGMFLIAAPYDDETQYSLGSFRLGGDLTKFKEQVKAIFIYHSKDDAVVRFSDAKKYKKTLPEAHIEIFEDRGHFNQEEFPEIARDIKNLFT